MRRFIFYLSVLFLSTIFSCKKSPFESTNKLPEQYRFKNQYGYVNDFADFFSVEQENEMEKLFLEYDQQTTNELGVLTVNSIAPYKDITEFADAVLNDWRFGKDDQYNGVLIVLEKNRNQIAIRYGIGIQKKITNAEAQQIIDKIIIPEFKKNNFYVGIQKGSDAIKIELK